MARHRLLPVAITLAVLAAAAYGTWTWLAGRHPPSKEQGADHVLKRVGKGDRAVEDGAGIGRAHV